MTSPSETQAYYDDFSTRYEDRRAAGYHALVDNLELDAVLPHAVGKAVLEVGCGTGLILRRLAEVAESAVGVDLSPDMLSKALARGLKGVVGSATDLPFDDASFDVTCSFKVLAHVPEIGRALAEMARVTRPGGIVVAELYNRWSLRYLAKLLSRPGAVSARRTEADVYTRWDDPTVIARILPPELEIVELRGVRVLTPAAMAHDVPVLGRLLGDLERRASTSALRYFGGFLVVIMRRRAA